ncbi:GGDEF domain-containing protein [uncultured Mitsuokella sp.]|uniref:GGDEF domain-containing protein n=1 Tax=uncultured Mitsuokella sp. TaxID=453120 RepID=UPI0025F69B10|nr:GGDEF domain-containing protein [uncultured Mitsuokella sp.]
MKTSSCVLIEDIEVLKENDPIDYYNLKRQGVKRLLDVPFYHDGKLIGYLGADNYEVNDLINTRGILETISYFIGAKITNHNLLRKLERLSRYDDLTGLHNRNAMIEKVGWMKKSAGPVGLIYADLNGLKEINDSLGHQAGDEALRQVAELLIQRYGIENSYRMGGDEFMVLLPMIAECDFRSSVRHLREIVIKDKNISLAIGSEWIDNAAQLDEAIRISDHRMYCDKVEYYNRCGKGENDRQGVRNKEIFAPSGQVSLA